MKRMIILFGIISLGFPLSGKSYKPYPILWIHGIGSNSGTWGAPTRNRSDSIPRDSVEAYPNATYSKFLNYMNTYAIEWKEFDDSYTIPGDDAYPNKTFLEVINMDDPVGSLDPDYKYPGPYSCQGEETYHRIKEIMNEYYGEGWEEDTTAKIVVVAHSLGGISFRSALYQYPEIKPHIAKVITIGAPHSGTPVGYFQYVIESLEYLYIFFPTEKLAWGISGLSELLQYMKPLNSFTPAGYDATTHSDFLDKINDDFQGDGYSWHCLVGYKPWSWADPTGESAISLGGILIGIGLTPPTNMALVWTGSSLVTSGGVLIYWNHNSDNFIPTYSANINRACPDYPYNAEVTEVEGLDHPSETSKWRLIRNLSESPPTLDSMLLTTRLEDSTVVDTSYFTPDTIDTIVGNLDSVSVNFKLMDSYFLSQADVKININGVSSGGINYPEETSLTARV